MQKVLIATKNRNKTKELKKLLKRLDIAVRDITELKTYVPNVIEDGKTFRQNAIKKAVTFSRYVEGVVLADDSGLEAEALEGKPGVRSARFAHTKATDKENTAKLLKFMEKVPQGKRGATFVCVIAIAKNGNLLNTAEGKCVGSIGYKSKGGNGFGYDPVFTPVGYNKTFAEISSITKNKISHRAKALLKAKSVIKKHVK